MNNKLMMSAIVLTKNEEDRIERCLSSLVSLDEIIVIDSGSLDKTLDIAKSFAHVKIINTEWLGFSKTKDVGISQAKHDWIFWVDADEEITPALSLELKSISLAVATDVYSIRRQNHFLGEKIYYSGWQKDWVVRIFNRKHAKLDGKEVHEKLIYHGKNIKLRELMNHYTFRSLQDYINKINQYTTLGAEQRYKNSVRVSSLDLVVKPFFRFLRHFIIQKGFLDGTVGLVISIFSAYSVFLRSLKLYLMNKKNKG